MQPFIDSFGRLHTYLRISVTDRCNLRCTYCMPDNVTWKPRSQILSFEEIERFVRLCAASGVTKIRITGGEPLVRQGIIGLIERLKGIPGLESVGMTSNGVLLRGNVAALRAAGLDAINISLDSLRSDRFDAITRTTGFFDTVVGSIDESLGEFPSVKVNCVVKAGFNDDEIVDFAQWTESHPVNVRFIEYMPFQGNGWRQTAVMSYAAMKDALSARYELQALPSPREAVAKDFRIKGHTGTVSFITSMTDNFCGGCNRLRITADGWFKNCLFSSGEAQIRDLMRAGATDDALHVAITSALAGKKARHNADEDAVVLGDRPMVEIGG